MSASANIVILGDPDSTWATTICSQLREHWPLVSDRLEPRPECSAEELATADILIVLQSWPGEFSATMAESLLIATPLARLFVVLGPWCVSERRRSQAWPVAVCITTPELPARLELLDRELSGQSAPILLTANRDEVFAIQTLASPASGNGPRP